MQDQQTTNATKYLEGEMNAIREVISSCVPAMAEVYHINRRTI